MIAQMKLRIEQTDALSFIQSLEAESIGALITDPPYSSGGSQRDVTKATGHKYCNTDSQSRALPDFLGETMDQAANVQFSYMWLREAFRVMKPTGYVAVFTDWRQLPIFLAAIQMAGFSVRGICVWDKTEGARPQKNGFRNQAEFIVWATKGPKRTGSPVYAPGVFRKAPGIKPRLHQTQKPLELIEWLMSVADPTEAVLDPFLGSGTTGVAATRLARDFYGCELSVEIFDIASNRINAEVQKCRFPGL